MVRAWTLLLIMPFVGCGGGDNPPVDFVVPKGFTGPFWMLLDPVGEDLPMVDGRYRVVIPADGMLRVRSFRPFERWHETTARDDDGTPLPQSFLGGPAGPDVRALRGGGLAVTLRDGEEIRWMQFFVGTAEEHGERPEMDVPPVVGR